ncbi:hypothetical protein GSF04_13760 [Pseudoalteromonas sp. A22]|uniref:hypothetical protein n=1 Tax=Pseudoalteromonas TaxID=53246 RepID=UPI001BA94F8A|nr:MULTISPECIES: hypothetical protein [Pseudoalteromonas]MCG7553773.1 hypothetical protein [Pseudoalteromonas sp. Of11M-6]QUI63508.1 hypothetical protein GSF04_13760 [Pseudoalteromonas sp. A22]USE69190.1 hypothetical protein CTT31_08680 [Pseudoalteromonas flavipulchra]
MANLIKKAGHLGRAYAVLELVYRQFYKNGKDANEAYLKMLPLVKDAIKTHGRDSEVAIGALELLADLAPFGAKRRNFKRRYVDKPDGWKQLPADPNQLSYGYWY